MRSGPDDRSRPYHLDAVNVAAGAVVSSLLVALLGFGTVFWLQGRTPREDGVNIGAALLGILGCLLGVAVGAAFAAQRARRRAGDPMTEGICAGLAGFMLDLLGLGLLFVAHGVPLSEMLNPLSLLFPGVGAASAGAAIGGRLGRLARRPPRRR